MHKSPSLFFEILAEEDEEKRNEKIKRASFEIKAGLNASPPGPSQGVARLNGSPPPPAGPATPTAAAAADSAAVPAPPQQQWRRQPDGAPDGAPGDSASGGQDEGQQQLLASSQGGQQRQQQQQHPHLHLQLSPQEVLQELLGDLYIDHSRLAMGERLGQGGFADVHAATLADPLLGFQEEVAVKRLRPDALQDPSDLREFLTEANLLRKLAHRNIVQLRGVGASDLTDLVSMRESMFVVQEFMAGGDLKQLVVAAMARPFDLPYTKAHAFSWAMQVAEAMAYLHSVCRPMIIHRDLKLDNVLLTGGDRASQVAKLADFGLHKRVRRMVSSGALVTWDQEATYRGCEYEASFYGGNLYYAQAMSALGGSAPGGLSQEASTHGGSSLHKRAVAQAAAAAAGGDGGAGRGGKPPLPARWPAGPGGCEQQQQEQQEQSMPCHSRSSSAGGSAQCNSGPPLPSQPALPGEQQQHSAAVTHSDSAKSFQQAASAAATLPLCGAGATSAAGELAEQQQQLLSAVRAKSQGLLDKPEFVARVLSASANPELLQGPSGSRLMRGDREVSRTIAAAQALEGSVRAGNAFGAAAAPGGGGGGAATAPEITPAPPPAAGEACGAGAGAGAGGPRARRAAAPGGAAGLCPQLVERLQSGLAAARDSQQFIEATQKVGSLLYMAPEVLRGNQYNEKIDVFSFGIILYELLSGVVLAGRVALGGEHEQLLDYAREVAGGRREALPPSWPPAVRALVAACWAQEPSERPGFQEVLRQLYAIKQQGLDDVMEGLRPRGGYNPVADCGCGCAIM